MTKRLLRSVIRGAGRDRIVSIEDAPDAEVLEAAALILYDRALYLADTSLTTVAAIVQNEAGRALPSEEP